jgi:hypothetical protein
MNRNLFQFKTLLSGTQKLLYIVNVNCSMFYLFAAPKLLEFACSFGVKTNCSCKSDHSLVSGNCVWKLSSKFRYVCVRLPRRRKHRNHIARGTRRVINIMYASEFLNFYNFFRAYLNTFLHEGETKRTIIYLSAAFEHKLLIKNVFCCLKI